MTITLRSVKGSALTHAELDANFAGATITSRGLDGGAGTLTPTASNGMAILTDYFVLTGDATGSFNITIADGTTDNQRILFVVTGNPNAHVILLMTGGGATAFSAIYPSHTIEAWWDEGDLVWRRRGLVSHSLSQVPGSGSPLGVAIPALFNQVYRDTTNGDLWMATGWTVNSWTLISGGSSGGASFTTIDDGNTAIAVGAAPSTHRRLTSNSAITLTLSATAAPGVKQSFVKKGSGTITVLVPSGATYRLPGDTIGQTASFSLISGYFECVQNIGNVAAVWDFEGNSSHAETADNDLNLNNFEIYGARSPFQTGTTGPQASAGSARSRTLSGNVTGVPVTNGWWNYYYASGGVRTITPASGSCILPNGTSQATATLASGTRAIVRGDGTNLLVDGGSVS